MKKDCKKIKVGSHAVNLLRPVLLVNCDILDSVTDNMLLITYAGFPKVT